MCSESFYEKLNFSHLIKKECEHEKWISEEIFYGFCLCRKFLMGNSNITRNAVFKEKSCDKSLKHFSQLDFQLSQGASLPPSLYFFVSNV